MRFVHLTLGVYIGIQTYQTQSILSGLLAGFLLYQVFTNSGCGGAYGCALPLKKKNNDTAEDVEYEEITTK
ncbi:hypothetical protein CXF59_05015 [Flavobacterium sp. ALD4]|uniref:hypothetical protein n=1 Tax=Flavobacterium sp. ALD4 TaxID=2058314 RepID=UPI000C32AAEC|nr:hypothetical protein [Flavobacterium sp. ALD4]PKH68159.1 hypothetical protein CXF59_05015 [Flavobacterium sp. ALD4]